MKRIGIITIVKVDNYGAELQAYATQAFLKQLGYDAEIIDYLFYKNPDFISEKSSRSCFKLSTKQRFKEWLYPIISSFNGCFHTKDRRRRKENFDSFHRNNTSFSQTFHNYKELRENCPHYDIFLTGSDQVWNPNNNTSLEPYLLSFTPNNAKRVSFAASFGVGNIPDYAKALFNTRLKRYNAIGVREQNAVDIVKEISGKDAEWVLDPTLMLSHRQWLNVGSEISLPFNGSYLLIYELTPCAYVKQVAEAWAKHLNIPLVRICKEATKIEKDGSVLNIIDAGPAEFIRLFDNATAIVTNSFHGSAFAINFNKDFYTIIPARKQNNSRQTSLLNQFGLSDRLLKECDKLPDFQKINYQHANDILANERRNSLDFIYKAIE